MAKFEGGNNIALKLPPHQFEPVLAFYRDILKLPVIQSESLSWKVAFGPVTLWLDRVETMTQAELWLEIATDDTAAAASHLAKHHVVRCDKVEPFPESVDGFWIANPAGIVHLVAKK